MEQIKYDVFISYSRKDYVDDSLNVIPENCVQRIMKALEDASITYWIDEKGIFHGEEFAGVIAEAIDASSIFVFVSSESSNNSPWTTGEIATAQEAQKKIIPVRIDSSRYHKNLRVRLNALDYISFAANPQKGCLELVRTIKEYLKEHNHSTIEELNANISFLTGIEYYYGMNGKKMDYTEAAYWYRKAAEIGHVEAMYSLANCYFHAKGVDRDYDKAKDLYERAAQRGHIEAQYHLGRCYKKGFGTPVNSPKAFAWFLKAAEQGYALAQNNVAVCYEDGIGVDENEEEAVKWYQLANEQGDAFAHESLVRLGKLPKS